MPTTSAITVPDVKPQSLQAFAARSRKQSSRNKRYASCRGSSVFPPPTSLLPLACPLVSRTRRPSRSRISPRWKKASRCFASLGFRHMRVRHHDSSRPSRVLAGGAPPRSHRNHEARPHDSVPSTRLQIRDDRPRRLPNRKSQRSPVICCLLPAARYLLPAPCPLVGTQVAGSRARITGLHINACASSFLGTGNAFASGGRNAMAILLLADGLGVLLDCGPHDPSSRSSSSGSHLPISTSFFCRITTATTLRAYRFSFFTSATRAHGRSRFLVYGPDGTREKLTQGPRMVVSRHPGTLPFVLEYCDLEARGHRCARARSKRSLSKLTTIPAAQPSATV